MKDPYDLIHSAFDLQRAIDQKEIDIHIKIDGFALLHFAAVVGDGDVIRILLDHGVDVDEISPDGTAALHTYAYLGKPRYVDLLLRANANPNIRDADGLLPDEVTKEEIIKQLIQDARVKYRASDTAHPKVQK